MAFNIHVGDTAISIQVMQKKGLLVFMWSKEVLPLGQYNHGCI